MYAMFTKYHPLVSHTGINHCPHFLPRSNVCTHLCQSHTNHNSSPILVAELLSSDMLSSCHLIVITISSCPLINITRCAYLNPSMRVHRLRFKNHTTSLQLTRVHQISYQQNSYAGDTCEQMKLAVSNSGQWWPFILPHVFVQWPVIRS